MKNKSKFDIKTDYDMHTIKLNAFIIIISINSFHQRSKAKEVVTS